MVAPHEARYGDRTVVGPSLASVGVAVLDASGTIRSASAALARLLHRPLAELVDRPLREALGGVLPDGTAPAPFDAAHYDTRVHVGDAALWVRVTIAEAPRDGGPAGTYLAVIEDISETRRTEQRERVQRAVAELLSVASPLGEEMLELFCRELGWDAGRLWLASRARELRFMQLWVHPDAGLPEPHRTRVAARDSLAARAWLARRPVWQCEPPTPKEETEPAGLDGLTSGLAFPIVLDDEVLGVIDLWGRTKRAEEPETLALAATVGRQIAQFIGRRRAEVALRGSQKQLTSIIDNTPALVLVTHVDGRLLRLNRSAEATFGVDRASAVGRPFRDVLPEAIATSLAERIDDVVAGDTKTDPAESVERLPLRNELRTYLAQHFALPDGTAQPYAVSSILTDITDRERAEHDLRLLAGQVSAADDAARRKLARDIHDSIGQTLSAIKMDLGRALREPERHDELVATLARGVGLVDEVIAQTRTLTFDLYPAMLDDLGLVPTLQSYADGFGAAARMGVTVTESGRRREPATALRNYLFRAVKELLNNVRKHANASQVLVAVRFTESRIRILVADDGDGFDPTLALSPQKRTGLGLADMRQHVAFLGGELHIDAEQSRGTQVILELPLEERIDG